MSDRHVGTIQVAIYVVDSPALCLGNSRSLLYIVHALDPVAEAISSKPIAHRGVAAGGRRSAAWRGIRGAIVGCGKLESDCIVGFEVGTAKWRRRSRRDLDRAFGTTSGVALCAASWLQERGRVPGLHVAEGLAWCVA